MSIEQLNGLMQVIDTFGTIAVLVWIVLKNDKVVEFYRDKLEKWESLIIDSWKQQAINLRDTEITRRNPRMQADS